MVSASTRAIFERQGVHFVAYLLLGAVMIAAVLGLDVGAHTAWGASVLEWAAISWVFAGVMQAWIWFFWRLELHLGAVSRRLGPAGVRLFQVGFLIWPIGRFAPLIPIAIATAHTSPIPRGLALARMIFGVVPIEHPLLQGGRVGNRS